jgi:hypothetical protein
MAHRRNVVPHPRKANAAQRAATQLDKPQTLIVDLIPGGMEDGSNPSNTRR